MKGLDSLALALEEQEQLAALGPIWGLLQEFDGLESWLEPNEHPALELAHILHEAGGTPPDDRRTTPIDDQALVEAMAGLAVWEYRAASRGLERWNPLAQTFDEWGEGNQRQVVVWRRHDIDIDADYRARVLQTVRSALGARGAAAGPP